jgi:hypothetical protein
MTAAWSGDPGRDAGNRGMQMTRARSYLYGILVAAVLATVLAMTPGPAVAAVPAHAVPADVVVAHAVPVTGERAAPDPGPAMYSETFAGDSAGAKDTWIAGAGRDSALPCLTAGRDADVGDIASCHWKHPDGRGQGVLRLTGNGRQQSGFVLYTKPLNATQGLYISFDMYQYDTTTPRGGADGIGFVLIDGKHAPVTAGAPGGWLGYRGLDGAYLGVGFDEWGNFSNRALWGSGPNRLVPDSIVVRGAGSAHYPYIVAAHTSAMAVDGTRNRADARRHVVIKISTSGVMTVAVNFGHGLVREIRGLDLDDVPGQPPLPPTVKFGFTGATGDDTDVHEVSDLIIRGLRPDLRTRIVPQGKFRAGGTGALTATVSADASGGPTTGGTTALIDVPGSLSPQQAQGDGWSCATAGQQVSCTRDDTLRPGESFPPISVTTAVAHDAPRKLTVLSSAHTPHMYLSPGNKSHATVPIVPPPPGPDLSVKISPIGELVAGGGGKLRLDVSNAKHAGPTTGPVALTYRVPADSSVVSAQGTGWACGVATKAVNCDRPDVLPPGHSFPPVILSNELCHKAECRLTGASATVTTPGTGPATTSPVRIPVTQHSSLGLSLSSNPEFPEPGYDTTFTAVVTNGGPTDVENAELDITVPPGFTGAWSCQATAGSGCPGTLGSGRLKAELYVASGGTVTLTATGQASGTTAAEVPVSAKLWPPSSYIDLYCSETAPCTTSGDDTAGDAAK